MKKGVIETIQEMLSDYSFNTNNIPDGIKYILENELWEVRDPAPGKLTKVTFKNFKEFCEYGRPFGLNTRFKYIYDLCKDYNDILDLIDQANINEVERDDKGRFAVVDNINIGRPTGTSKDFGLRTLRSRRPDLHSKVINNELSVNAAMIEAGFRKKKIQVVLDDIQKIADSLIKHLSKEEIEELIEIIRK